MKEVLTQEYNNLKQILVTPKPVTNNISITFVKGAKVEINGKVDKRYLVKFIDKKTNNTIHQSHISTNMWTQANYQYFVDYKIEIEDLEDNTVTEHHYNAENKKVYIHFASKALGDTIAWFPYAEEFRKKHKCEVVVSTFHNRMFEENYPEIEFVNPGTMVYNLYAMYEIGWHYNEDETVDYNKNISDFKRIGLQETSSETLGIEHTEIKPKLTYKNTGRFLKHGNVNDM